MHIVKDSEKLFDEFTATGLNAKQVMQEAASIVQNDGVELSEQDIIDWTREQMLRVEQIHQDMIQVIRNTSNALFKM